jgi:WD40 repeat protein
MGNREARGIDLSVDGKRVVMVSRGLADEVGGRVVDVETGKDVCTLVPQPLPFVVGAARFSADGTRVARVAEGVARIWSATTGADAVPLPGHRGVVTSLVPTLDGKRIVSAGTDLSVRAWDPRTGKELWRTTFARTPRVRFETPEGLVVQEAIYGAPGPGALLDATTGKRRPLPGALGRANSAPGDPLQRAADEVLAMTPDGKSVVTLARYAREADNPDRDAEVNIKQLIRGGHPSAFRVWSWPGGELKKTLMLTPPEGLALEGCSAAHVTPDGKQLFAVVRYRDLEPERRVRIRASSERWDLTTGTRISRSDSGTGDKPAKLIPSADGILVLADGPELRDAVTGVRAVKLTAPEKHGPGFHWVSTAALSPDGRVLALGNDWNNTVWLFEMRTGKPYRALHPDGHRLRALRFLPDGRLVTAGDTALVWATGLPADPDAPDDLAALWPALAEADPVKARPAMAKLAGRSARAVEFIRARVPVVPRIKEGDMARRDGPDSHPDELRTLRAIEVLEVIGSADARAALEALAAGEPSARATREAASALRRLPARE